MRRILSVFFEQRTYVSLGYVLLRLPLALVYSGIIGFIAFRGLQNLLSLILLVPAGMAIWGGVITERSMARHWFGARLTPMSPERPPDRTWGQRVVDLVSNPVTCQLHAQGDILNHEFQISAGDAVVATVSKQWFAAEFMYGIAIAPGQDEVLMLCVAIAIDEMSETDRR